MRALATLLAAASLHAPAPRTAETPVRLDALDKDVFLAAVCGFAPSERAADELVQARLERATIAP